MHTHTNTGNNNISHLTHSQVFAGRSDGIDGDEAIDCRSITNNTKTNNNATQPGIIQSRHWSGDHSGMCETESADPVQWSSKWCFTAPPLDGVTKCMCVGAAMDGGRVSNGERAGENDGESASAVR